jgi:tRNA pseudouridine55 synthase
MNGIVLIDKPAGCTSHDVVNRWRRLAHTKRVGHLGTLDPMATGLLILITGTATRLAQYFGKEQKTYDAKIRFGCLSDTYDAEGQITETGSAIPTADEIFAALERFRGRFLQVPPPVSAKKIGGVPAYKLARKQMPVDLKPAEVEVSSLMADWFSDGQLTVSVTCSAGTYIRSIAHDLGQLLGCGALLTSLRRTAVGEYHVSQAKTLEQLTELAAAGHLADAMVPTRSLLQKFPAVYFDAQAEASIRFGRDFRTSPFVVPPGAPFVRALSHSGELIAIGELRIPNIYHPGTVL